MSARDSTPAPRPPTARERAHFAAVGEAMAAEKALQIQRAARADTADGIVVGLKLAALFPPTPSILALEAVRSAEQIGLRRRALAVAAFAREGRPG